MGLDTNNFNNLFRTIAFAGALQEFENSWKTLQRQRRMFSASKVSRRICWRIGILLMRIGGKLVYLGRPPFEATLLKE